MFSRRQCFGAVGRDEVVEHLSSNLVVIPWTLAEGVALCTAIQSISPKYGCHPALTGGLLYKEGPRKDCDVVIYQRGDVDGERPEIDWLGLWAELKTIGIELVKDFGYVKKCLYQGKSLDIFDPTEEGGNYGTEDEQPPTQKAEIPIEETVDADIEF